MLIFLLACSSDPSPTTADVSTTPEPVEEPTTWHEERDSIGRWSADVPANKLKRSEKKRSFAPDADEPVEVVWQEISGRSYGTLKAEVRVGWLDRPADMDDPLAALSVTASAPDSAEDTLVSGFSARRWETKGALGHWTSVVVATPDRLYYVRFSDSEEERAETAHSRFFDSFVLLGEDQLTAADRERVDAAQAKAVQDALDAVPLTDAEIAANRERARVRAVEQMRTLFCTVPSTESGAGTLKLSIQHGKVTSARLFAAQTSWGNNPIKPKQRSDMLSACVEGRARSWTFPADLSASNVEVPVMML
jgi:hypothetical protein